MNRHFYQSKRIIAGIILLAIAALLVLWKTDVITTPAFFEGVGLGGIIISAVMVIVLVHSTLHLWYTGMLFPLAVLGIIYAKPLGIPEALVPWTLLGVALFGSIGLHLIFPKKFTTTYTGPRPTHGHDHFAGNNSTNPNGSGNHQGEWTTEKSSEDQGHVFHSLRMGSGTKYIHMNEFVGADLKCELGELKVYFDGSQIPSGSAKVNVSVALGSMEIYVPRNWRVETHVSTSLGNAEIDNKDGNGVPEGPVLEIVGEVRLGNLEIKRL